MKKNKKTPNALSNPLIHWKYVGNNKKLGLKKKANMKCSVFKYEQTRALQSVAGINNKTFGDEPLKADASLGAKCLGGSNSGGLKWSLTSFSTSKAERGNAFIRRGLEVNWLTKKTPSPCSFLLNSFLMGNGEKETSSQKTSMWRNSAVPRHCWHLVPRGTVSLFSFK